MYTWIIMIIRDIIPIDVYLDHHDYTVEEQCFGTMKSPTTNEEFWHLQA
jgi:hypothetical protein